MVLVFMDSCSGVVASLISIGCGIVFVAIWFAVCLRVGGF